MDQSSDLSHRRKGEEIDILIFYKKLNTSIFILF